VIAFMGFVFGGVAFNTGVERSSVVYGEGIFGNEPNARSRLDRSVTLLMRLTSAHTKLVRKQDPKEH